MSRKSQTYSTISELTQAMRTVNDADVRTAILAEDTRRQELAALVEADHAPPILFYGPPGTGKSTQARQLGAARSGRQVYALPASERRSGVHLLEYLTVEGNSMAVREGLGLRAWRDGACLVIEEIDHAGPDMASVIQMLATRGLGATVTLQDGREITPNPAYLLVATTNAGPEALADPVADRFVAIHARYPTLAQIRALPPLLGVLAMRAYYCADQLGQFGGPPLSYRVLGQFAELEARGMARETAANLAWRGDLASAALFTDLIEFLANQGLTV